MNRLPPLSLCSYANTSYLEGGPAVGPVPEAVVLGPKEGLVARPKDHW